MGSTTKTVGGGSATGVANDFNGFLKQGLQNGSYGTVGQTQGLGSSINTLINGRTSDPTGLQDYQRTLSQMEQMGRYNPASINPTTSADPNAQAGNGVNQALGGIQGLNLSSKFNAGPAYSQRDPTVNSPLGAALQQILSQQQNRDIGDLHARYGMSGGAQGTPALQAESLYRSQALPQTAAALGQVDLQQQGLDQGAANLNSQNSLANWGQGLQAILGGGNLALGQNSQTLQNNQFNSGQNFNAQSQNAQNGLQGQSLLQQLLGMQGNLALQGGQLNLANANSNSQNMQQALQMMLQQYGQANQLGTPQAQTVQQKGLLGQIGDAASGLGNLFGSFSGFGNIFGGSQPGGLPGGFPGSLPPIQQTPGMPGIPGPNAPIPNIPTGGGLRY